MRPLTHAHPSAPVLEMECRYTIAYDSLLNELPFFLAFLLLLGVCGGIHDHLPVAQNHCEKLLIKNACTVIEIAILA